ncbi:hypothetical protein CP989_25440, partial [Enterobacter hormaechei]
YRSHKFCGYCGHPMHASKSEWAMLCSHCHGIVAPGAGSGSGTLPAGWAGDPARRILSLA